MLFEHKKLNDLKKLKGHELFMVKHERIGNAWETNSS